ncbi:MAG: hypothetical protein QM778_24095 [Myxococcales bacterium]
MKKLHFAALCGLVLLACGGDEKDNAGPSLEPDAGEHVDAGSDAGVPPDCFANPKTHLEIINACSDAERVEANPVLPLLGADGGLPPLP